MFSPAYFLNIKEEDVGADGAAKPCISILLFSLSELAVDMRSLVKTNQNHQNANAVIRQPLWDNDILSFANVGGRAESSSRSSGGNEESRLDLAPRLCFYSRFNEPLRGPLNTGHLNKSRCVLGRTRFEAFFTLINIFALSV